MKPIIVTIGNRPRIVPQYTRATYEATYNRNAAAHGAPFTMKQSPR